jgi:hypothetical protein
MGIAVVQENQLMARQALSHFVVKILMRRVRHVFIPVNASLSRTFATSCFDNLP